MWVVMDDDKYVNHVICLRDIEMAWIILIVFIFCC